MLRWSNNLGIAIGPLIGGSIATASYSLAFYAAAAGMITFSLLLAVFARETIPTLPANHVIAEKRERLGGYPAIFKDKAFTIFLAAFTLVSICAVLMWTIMPVYANRYFAIPESLYKWIPATNAIMVVVFQSVATRMSRRYLPLLMLSVGSFFYAIAVGSVAFAHGFLGFWIAMVIMTVGELILVPTSSTYVANLAPVDKRGRYMSLYGLVWPIGAGIGPLFGGILSDTLGPRSTWFGGLVVGFIGMAVFVLLARHLRTAADSQPLIANSTSQSQ